MIANNVNEALQSAYKPGHSCETALIKIFNDLLTHLDQNHEVLVALLDLSAAFDTVDHTLLLQRLETTHGISGTALRWGKSYLSERTMRVTVDVMFSNPVTLDVGLPQGPQLGPRFYSDYTQPMGRLIRLLLLLYPLYANDTQLLKPVLSKSTLPGCIAELTTGIERIAGWMKDNKLTINCDKTEFLIVSSRKNQKYFSMDSIEICGGAVVRSDKAKNLGVIIDSTLDMDN